MHHNEKVFNKKSIKAIILGMVSSVVVVIIMFLLSGLAILQLDSFPEKYLIYIILCILAVGGFVGGYVTSRIIKSNGLLYGSMTGIGLFLLIFISGLSSIMGGFTLFTLLKLIVILLSASLGGVIGVNKKTKFTFK